MTDTNNGWPGKPGVPLHPDQNRWHWVDGTPCEWIVFCSGGWWRGNIEGGGVGYPHEWTHRIYQGPCLTPDGTAAQQKRIVELEAALQDAARVLHKAGEQFSEYAKKHAAYRTAVGDLKAAANQQWAQRCFNAHNAALEGRER